MLSSIWKERDSDRSREKGVLGKDVLENNCSKYFLKVSISKFLVKHLRLPAKIWKPIALLNPTSSTTPGISQNKKDSGHTPPFLFHYHSFNYSSIYICRDCTTLHRGTSEFKI